MPAQARISSPDDRDKITALMQRALSLKAGDITIEPAFQQWKYWSHHPFTAAGRSYVLDGQGSVIAHGCRWPMRILTAAAGCDGFHLIDWAAETGHAGAGLQVLRDMCANSAALFSIGGSPATQRMLPTIGELLRRRAKNEAAPVYRVAGPMYFMSRPLKPFAAALEEEAALWKTAGRIVRNTYRAAWPTLQLPGEYSFQQITPAEIAEHLWPHPASESAVTARTAELLQHFANCPVLRQPMYFVLNKAGRACAYFFLVLAGQQVRVADFGPGNLDQSTSHALAMATQLAAKRHYPKAVRISTATSEMSARDGFLAAGFRLSYQEEIRALLVDPALQNFRNCRLTYLDLDALCL